MDESCPEQSEARRRRTRKSGDEAFVAFAGEKDIRVAVRELVHRLCSWEMALHGLLHRELECRREHTVSCNVEAGYEEPYFVKICV